jgi:4-hydroxy-tetrahydrodipicolinate reductase
MPETAVVALFGARGKMGREILRLNREQNRLDIRYGYDPGDSGETVEGLSITPPPESLPADVRLVVDFSIAQAVATHCQQALERRAAYLCGVTGLKNETMQTLQTHSAEIALIYSPNLSPAMNLMFALAQTASRALPDYARQIIEIHHTAKKDAPSGTALRLADAVGDEPPITALRMGDVVGEHRLILGGPGERLEIIHRADSRSVFASGALRAAEWLVGQQPGFYTMKDVLGL